MIKADFKLKAFHPGEVLREDFLKPLKLKQAELADRMGVSRSYVSEICRCQKGISVEFAFRLSKVFGTDPGWWLRMQLAWDMQVSEGSAELMQELEHIVPIKMPGSYSEAQAA